MASESGARRRVSLGKKLRTIVWLVAILPVCVALTLLTVLSLVLTLPLVLYSAFKQHREKNPWRRSTSSNVSAAGHNSNTFAGSAASQQTGPPDYPRQYQ